MTSSRPDALTPHLFVSDAPAAVAWYESAFGARELFRNTLPDGRLLFCEVAVGAARLLISEETPSLGALSPPSVGGTPVLLLLEVADPDVLFGRAIAEGATEEMPLREMFWGERYGVLRDPYGHRWAVSTARQDLSPDDITTRTPDVNAW